MYKSYFDCQAQLHEVEPFDFYFAEQINRQYALDDSQLYHLLMALCSFLREGHTCLPLAQISGQSLWSNPENPAQGFVFENQCELNKRLQTLPMSEHGFPIVYQNQQLYLRRYWQFEETIAKQLNSRKHKQLLNAEQAQRLKALLDKIFSPAGEEELNWQAIAVANAIGRPLSIICGGPGTGKTYTVARLLLALQYLAEQPLNILMAAPTGKAAHRLSESIAKAKVELARLGIAEDLLKKIPDSAVTLHRLLGYRPRSVAYKYNANSQLPCQVLLLDEVSMIDVAMMSRIVSALPETASLIMLGDADQLPSVESGNLLADLTERPHPGYSTESGEQIKRLTGYQVPKSAANAFEHVSFLHKSHRFFGELAELASAVIQQSEKATKILLKHQLKQAEQTDHAIAYYAGDCAQSALKQSCQLYYLAVMKAPNPAVALERMAAFRVLCALKKGTHGSQGLNVQIETWLREKNPQVRPQQDYPGRPIMITENDYHNQLFNGDSGIIWRQDNGRLAACFEPLDGSAQLRVISLARLPKYESLYAMTIHKTQGSEFNHVALYLPDIETPLLNAELLYTGITRAQKQLSVYGALSRWQSAVKQKAQRFSGLAAKLNPQDL